MSGSFFDRLEVELRGLTREGLHLDRAVARQRRRMTMLMRRSALIAVLALALAVSIDSEFAASANGRAFTAQISTAQNV